jgi:hypothetical protein
LIPQDGKTNRALDAYVKSLDDWKSECVPKPEDRACVLATYEHGEW